MDLIIYTLFQRRKIFFPKACQVMIHMTHDHINQCACADGVSAGGAAPERGLLAHIADGENVCAPQIFEFLDQILESVTVKTCLANKIVLFESRQGRAIIS